MSRDHCTPLYVVLSGPPHPRCCGKIVRCNGHRTRGDHPLCPATIAHHYMLSSQPPAYGCLAESHPCNRHRTRGIIGRRPGSFWGPGTRPTSLSWRSTNGRVARPSTLSACHPRCHCCIRADAYGDSAGQANSVTLYGATVSRSLGASTSDESIATFGVLPGSLMAIGSLPAIRQYCPGPVSRAPSSVSGRSRSLGVGLTTATVSVLRSAVHAAATSKGSSVSTRTGQRPEMLPVELQHQARRLEIGRRLRRLDRADHVDRLGVVGHDDDVALPGELVAGPRRSPGRPSGNTGCPTRRRRAGRRTSSSTRPGRWGCSCPRARRSLAIVAMRLGDARGRCRGSGGRGPRDPACRRSRSAR